MDGAYEVGNACRDRLGPAGQFPFSKFALGRCDRPHEVSASPESSGSLDPLKAGARHLESWPSAWPSVGVSYAEAIFTMKLEANRRGPDPGTLRERGLQAF